MRRTSSLGRRRSSTQSFQPLRKTFNISDNANSESKPSKKSMLLQPGFSRGKSAERQTSSSKKETTGLKRCSSQTNLQGSEKKMPSSMRKSNSQINLATPITPGYSLHPNLPSGSTRPDRSMLQSTESGRMSSIGGTKIMRKDTRPLSDREYLNAAVIRIQNFFQSVPEAHMLFGDKISLLHMTTNRFVDLVAFLTSLLGVRVIITKSNYIEELPVLMKKIGYRGKVDKSWLITVNAPHSSHHVIGLLEWLVIVVQCMRSVDIETMMYPDDINLSKDEDDELLNFKILKPYLKWYYDHVHSHKGYDEEAVHEQDELILNELLKAANLGDLEGLERNCKELEEECYTANKAEEDLSGFIQNLKEQVNILSTDKQSNIEFLQKSKPFIENTNHKIALSNKREEVLRKNVEDLKSELQQLRTQVDSQEIQLIDKEKMDGERLSLQREMNCYHQSHKDIENLVFKEDLQIVAVRKKVDSAILEYNKVITENRACEPKLIDAELDSKLLDKDAELTRQNVIKVLKDLKSSYKTENEILESEEERTTKSLDQINEQLDLVLDEKERLEAEKITQEDDIKKLKANLQNKRKEAKLECKALNAHKKELMATIPHIDTEELEKKKLELKEGEIVLAQAKEMGENLLKDITKKMEDRDSRIQVAKEKLLENLKALIE